MEDKINALITKVDDLVEVNQTILKYLVKVVQQGSTLKRMEEIGEYLATSGKHAGVTPGGVIKPAARLELEVNEEKPTESVEPIKSVEHVEAEQSVEAEKPIENPIENPIEVEDKIKNFFVKYWSEGLRFKIDVRGVEQLKKFSDFCIPSFHEELNKLGVNATVADTVTAAKIYECCKEANNSGKPEILARYWKLIEKGFSTYN
jgi:hypothetical protein